MSVKNSSILEQTAKYLLFAAVIASFFFFGWRVATKRAYVEHEKAQCEALAVSASLTAAEALSENAALARLVKELGRAEFVTDHMKMPGNNTVSVTIAAAGGGFTVSSQAASGWNSRSPQSAEFSLTLLTSGISYANEADKKIAARLLAAREAAVRNGEAKKHIFTFPHERPCPVPFAAAAAKAAGLSGEPVYILVSEQQK